MTQAEVELAVLDAINDKDRGVPAMLQAHTNACPHGKVVDRLKYMLAGALVTGFVLGGGGVFALVKMLL